MAQIPHDPPQAPVAAAAGGAGAGAVAGAGAGAGAPAPQEPFSYINYQGKIPLNLENPKDIEVGKKYFYLGGPGQNYGVVEVLSNDLESGILLEYSPPWGRHGIPPQVIIFKNDGAQLFKLNTVGGRRRKHRSTRYKRRSQKHTHKRKTHRRRR